MLNTLKQLETNLLKQKQLKAKFEQMMFDLKSEQHKIAQSIEGEHEFEPEVLLEIDPWLYWTINPKTDRNCIRAARSLKVIKSQSAADDKVISEDCEDKGLKLEQWMAIELDKRGAKNSNCGEDGMAYKRVAVKAKPVDFVALVKWAVENDCVDEILTKAAKGSFCEQYYDEKLKEDQERLRELGKSDEEIDKEAKGEYPPFLDFWKEYRVNFKAA